MNIILKRHYGRDFENLPSTKDTNATTDFVVTTNDGIKLTLLSKSGKVGGVLVEGVEALLGVLAVHSPVTANLVDGGLQGCIGETGLLENRCQ